MKIDVEGARQQPSKIVDLFQDALARQGRLRRKNGTARRAVPTRGGNDGAAEHAVGAAAPIENKGRIAADAPFSRRSRLHLTTLQALL